VQPIEPLIDHLEIIAADDRQAAGEPPRFERMPVLGEPGDRLADVRGELRIVDDTRAQGEAIALGHLLRLPVPIVSPIALSLQFGDPTSQFDRIESPHAEDLSGARDLGRAHLDGADTYPEFLGDITAPVASELVVFAHCELAPFAVRTARYCTAKRLRGQKKPAQYLPSA
jgi:hypothetical protein